MKQAAVDWARESFRSLHRRLRRAYRKYYKMVRVPANIVSERDFKMIRFQFLLCNVWSINSTRRRTRRTSRNNCKCKWDLNTRCLSLTPMNICFQAPDYDLHSPVGFRHRQSSEGDREMQGAASENPAGPLGRWIHLSFNRIPGMMGLRGGKESHVTHFQFFISMSAFRKICLITPSVCLLWVILRSFCGGADAGKSAANVGTIWE